MQWRWRVEEWTQAAALDRDAFSAAFCGWAASRSQSHTPLVALRDGRAVGMAWVATVESTPTPSAMTRRYGHVQSVYVVPEARNNQVGSALLERARQEGQRLGFDYLLVHPSAESLQFWRRNGFGRGGEFLALPLMLR